MKTARLKTPAPTPATLASTGYLSSAVLAQEDRRPLAVTQRRQQAAIQQSPRLQQAAQLQAAIAQRPQVQQPVEAQHAASVRSQQQHVAVAQLASQSAKLPHDAQKQSLLGGSIGGVEGDELLIEIFDELMNNAAFLQEVRAALTNQPSLGNEEKLILEFSAGGSRCSQDTVYISDKHRNDREDIRHDLAFELHNFTALHAFNDLFQGQADDLQKLRNRKKNTPGYDNNKSLNRRKVQEARSNEFTEWLNIVRLANKWEGDKDLNGAPGRTMGFAREPSLVTSAQSRKLATLIF